MINNYESIITQSVITRNKYDSDDPIYPKGVTIIETDYSDNMYKKVRIGDGYTPYFSLPCTYDSESIRSQLDYERYQYNEEIKRLKNQMDAMTHGMEDKINKMNKSITYIHSCKSCGAKLEIPENKEVFYCKYCDSVYVVGPVRLNSTI